MSIGQWFANGFKSLGLWIWNKILSFFTGLRDSFASVFDKLGWNASHVLFYILIIVIVFIIIKFVMSRR